MKLVGDINLTIVVASRLFNSIVIVADCRVSYQGRNEVDDNLQKIYQIADKIVLGFSGPLEGAYQILSLVKNNLRTYSKKTTADNLAIDLERWIRYGYTKVSPTKYRENLNFILASVEPQRAIRSTWRNSDGITIAQPSWFPSIPELHIKTLKPSPNQTNKLTMNQNDIYHVIGVTTATKQIVCTTIEKLFSFSQNQPALQAHAIVNSLMSVLAEENIPTIGGLFQGALLNTNGIQWLSYGLPSKSSDVTLEIENGQYLQRDNITGRTIALETIWDWHQKWGSKHQFGAVGEFKIPTKSKARKHSTGRSESEKTSPGT